MITEERARLAERVDVLEKQKLASKARIKGVTYFHYTFKLHLFFLISYILHPKVWRARINDNATNSRPLSRKWMATINS